jgi:hypothetical protein
MVGWFKERVIYTLIGHVGDGITWGGGGGGGGGGYHSFSFFFLKGLHFAQTHVGGPTQ